ncbi:hypothetical protein LguiA_021986 [Lonicera macranthoides]
MHQSPTITNLSKIFISFKSSASFSTKSHQFPFLKTIPNPISQNLSPISTHIHAFPTQYDLQKHHSKAININFDCDQCVPKPFRRDVPFCTPNGGVDPALIDHQKLCQPKI